MNDYFVRDHILKFLTRMILNGDGQNLKKLSKRSNYPHYMGFTEKREGNGGHGMDWVRTNFISAEKILGGLATKIVML